MLVHDAVMIPIAWFAAFWLRFNLDIIPPHVWAIALHTLPFVLVTQITVAFWVGVYRGIWRFASIPDLIRIIRAVLLGGLAALVCVFLMNRLMNMPRSVFPLYCLILVAAWSGPRLLYRILQDYFRPTAAHERVLIVGAGQAGEGLVRDLLRDPHRRYVPVIFLDDDKTLLGKDVQGIGVVGHIDQLSKYIQKYKIDLVMLAIPSATSQQMQSLVQVCDEIGVPYRTLPGLRDFVENRVTISALRKVEIEDLLGRDPVKLDWQPIALALAQKVVMVTGGGGSIGSELCRQIARQNPRQLILLENSEFNLYQIDQELKAAFPNLKIEALLIDVSDQKFLNRVFQQCRPDVIFHAAAYKHVPMLEYQLLAAVKNNIFATRLLADLAVQYRVKTFVLVSSDKAVNPTNIMGLSKRVAEIYCQNLNTQNTTHFITVRFGNVLGSTGSVVPLFRKQLEAGGPITVTHPDMTRYFMMIPEATSLILQAYTMGRGGEIFVLDMGNSVKIQYLAEQMIRLAGKEPGKDIQIVYTGIRPGEKLYEELFHGSESLKATAHKKISLAQSRQLDWTYLLSSFDQIDEAYRCGDLSRIFDIMSELVPEYQGVLTCK